MDNKINLKSDEQLDDIGASNPLDRTISYDGDTNWSSTSSTELLVSDFIDISGDFNSDCESTVSYHSMEDIIKENNNKRKCSFQDDDKAIKRRCPNNKKWVDDNNNTMDIDKDFSLYSSDIPVELFGPKPDSTRWEDTMNTPFIRTFNLKSDEVL